jgi:hypothetical protein
MASDLLDSNDGSGFCERHGRRLDLDPGSHGRLGSSGLVLGDGIGGYDGSDGGLSNMDGKGSGREKRAKAIEW